MFSEIRCDELDVVHSGCADFAAKMCARDSLMQSGVGAHWVHEYENISHFNT